MEETHDGFISEAVDILVELLKGKDYETVRRISYLVNTAKRDDLKKLLNKLKSIPIEELSDFADMVTRVRDVGPALLTMETKCRFQCTRVQSSTS